MIVQIIININKIGLDNEYYLLNFAGDIYYQNKEIIKVDKSYYRPTEVDSLLGDASKAKKRLKWKPKISFAQLVKEMVESDLKLYS